MIGLCTPDSKGNFTDRGRPAHVLLSIEHYQSLVAPAANIIDLLDRKSVV